MKKSLTGIMFVSGGELLLNYIKKIAKRNDIWVLHDSVEWYSPSEFSNGEKNIWYIKNNRLNEKLIDKSIKVIAISSFLENHFKSKGIDAIRIPVIMDVKNIIPCDYTHVNDVIRIIYAGSPGGKDHLKEMIFAVKRLSEEERKKLNFTIIGISRDQFEKSYPDLELAEVEGCVSFLGRKKREEVLDLIKRSDFSFLLRPAEERYAKAGFPTKVVESMSNGIPMLCNLTSDLELYLRNNENCILIENCDEDSCVKALRKVINLDNEALYTLKKNARITAEHHFNMYNYIEAVDNFLNQ
ncbi:MAG: glycosyltransferase family 4 protein [Acutalibacter sp.]|nr:glycosyltransferase family 4 protein [Acutalibacter sp.]